MEFKSRDKIRAVIFDVLNVLFISNEAFTYSLNTDLADILWRLDRHGIKLGYLTNGNGNSVNQLIEQGVLPNFAIKIASTEACFVKPDPAIYALLYDKLLELSISPQEALFVDDKEMNLKPAKRIGINTIQYVGFKTFMSDLRKLGLVVN